MTDARRHLSIFLALLALLAITRVGHFGTAVSLPDASIAVFFLGGLWLSRSRLGGLGCFTAYAGTAFLLDVSLARTAAEAAWCLTPAYGGLVAAYAAVWLFGRGLSRVPAAPTWLFAGLGLAAVVTHFFIANLSFWAISGYFGNMDGLTYAGSVLKYLPPYVGSTALYLALAWLIQHGLVRKNPQASQA